MCVCRNLLTIQVANTTIEKFSGLADSRQLAVIVCVCRKLLPLQVTDATIKQVLPGLADFCLLAVIVCVCRKLFVILVIDGTIEQVPEEVMRLLTSIPRKYMIVKRPSE